MLALGSPAYGKTFSPTREDDPQPGKCKPNNCSLREAITAANEREGADRVVLGKGRYRIELPDNGNDDNSNGDFDLVGEVRIIGQGPKQTTVDGAGVDRVFSLLTFSPHSLEGMTIRGGSFPAGVGGGVVIGPSDATLANVVIKGNNAYQGGGIQSVSTDLRLINSAVKNNLAADRGGGILLVSGIAPPVATIRGSVIAGNGAARGGGINVDGANAKIFDDEPSVSISKSVVRGNTATGIGGGIASSALLLKVNRTTISNNEAFEGGAIDLRSGPELPVTQVTSSTISGNTATNKAGGILADGNPFSGPDLPEEPLLGILNSTIAENRSNNDAGGIMGDNEATIGIKNSSIGFNVANADDDGLAKGGGLFQHSNASFSVDDSVLVENSVGQGGSDPDCYAAQIFSGAGNVISSMEGCSLSFTTPFNAYSDATIAKPLASNGGPTETMKVPNSSAAIGFATFCPKRDQRGARRPDVCDSGAFENKPKR